MGNIVNNREATMQADLTYLDPRLSRFRQISTRFDAEHGILWCFMSPRPRACFNLDLLDDLKKFVQSIRAVNQREASSGKPMPIRYSVLASRTPGVFNFGGDMEVFVRYVREKNSEGLRQYARTCVEIVYSGVVGYDLPVTTISLVQGDALGGGFEAALCNQVIVAEKSARFGLPEVLFNVFPGMGAYNLLAQRMDAGRAEKMILSGRLYSAEELHGMGVVDVLAEDGEGEKALQEYVSRHSRRRNCYQSVLKVRQKLRPISLEELLDVADIWVEAVMNIRQQDIKLMERLMRAQERVSDGSSVYAALG
jgi:DSF synthase